MNGDEAAIEVEDAEMEQAMMDRAKSVARQAVATYINPNDIARHITTQFDNEYGSFWHCLVTRSVHTHWHEDFGYQVNPKGQQNNFIHFIVGDVGILLFKTD